MAAVTESRLSTKTVQDQKNAPWWLAENSLTVLRNRYFLKTIDGEFTEDINGLIDRVCANQAHIDGLWAVAQGHCKCLTGLLPHEMTDKDVHALKDPNSKERALWPKEATVAYAKAFEKAFTEYRTLIRRGDYLPATPILINSGCRSGMLYSCFVIPMDDTLMRKPDEPEELCGIFDCVKAVVAVQKAGGGTGISVSRTRPRGDHIHGGKANEEKGITIGNTTGSIAWLEEVSDAVKHIEQGSARHGANMGILRIDHPDIVEFCTTKDGVKLRNFNISVGITDEFISLLEKTPEAVWMVTNPRTKENRPCRDVLGRVKNPEHNWTVQDLWDLIVYRAWDVGDPGLWFIDRVNATNPTPNLGEFECCNPSLRAGTLVLTKGGILPIQKLQDSRFRVRNLDGVWSEARCFLSGRNQRLWRVVLQNGEEIYTTREHKWPVLNKDGTWEKRATDQLCPNDRLPFQPPGALGLSLDPTLTRAEGFLVGFLYGDGWIGTRSGSNDPVVGITFSDEKLHLAGPVVQLLNDYKRHVGQGYRAINLCTSARGEHTVQFTSKALYAFLEDRFGIGPKEAGLPTRVWKSNDAFIEGFLDGLFSADGSVDVNGQKITLYSAKERLIREVRSLLGFMGIKSSLQTVTREGKFPNGKDYGKKYTLHSLRISGFHAFRFAALVEFSHEGKKKAAQQIRDRETRLILDGVMPIKSVEETDVREDVWDITVFDETRCFRLAHCITGNCGEQELLPNESCNLGSIILSRFVDLSFEKGTDELPAGIDWVRMGQAVQTAVRFHDAVIDSNIYTVEVPAIRKATKATRKIGLGIMGWWDMLVRLGIPYESGEALRLADKLMLFINNAARAESERLAEARGVFPAWEGSREQELGYKVRNATRTTIAPTGTISILAGNDVTGGIEPSFGLAFIRDTPGTGGKVEQVNGTFQEWLDAQVGSKRFHPDEARQILEAAFHGESVSKLVSPVLTDQERALFKVANEIDIEWHIKHQAAFQRHTDNSVSKTINAPNNAEVKHVEAAYRMAITHGLNGITVFRDGCLSKTGQKQPMSYKGGANEPQGQTTQARLQRGKPCDIRPIRPQMAISMKSLFGTVHLHITVDPRTEKEVGCELELFGCVGKGGDLALAQMEGIGRLASQVLRLGGTLELVADQLSGIGSKHTTLTSGGRRLSLEDTVGHMLLKYLEAKDRWGLRALLLCEVDEAELVAFVKAPLAGKQAALDEIWGGEDHKAKAKKLADNGHSGNLHGITCAKCHTKIVMVGGCAVCPGCGDGSC